MSQVSNQLKIRSIRAEQTLPLRQQVLWPDMPVSSSVLADDHAALHLGGYWDEQLVCVASVFDDKGARLRKFATHPDFQGRGIGSAMLTHIIATLNKQGASRFWCDARLSAQTLYQKFGLQPYGEPFAKQGVMFIRMQRFL